MDFRIIHHLASSYRHALQPDSDLIPYSEQVRERYEGWMQAQADAGRTFTDQQRAWLDAIADYIGINLAINVTDFNEVFYDRGGVQAALNAFGDANTLRQIVDELNMALAAA